MLEGSCYNTSPDFRTTYTLPVIFCDVWSHRRMKKHVNVAPVCYLELLQETITTPRHRYSIQTPRRDIPCRHNEQVKQRRINIDGRNGQVGRGKSRLQGSGEGCISTWECYPAGYRSWYRGSQTKASGFLTRACISSNATNTGDQIEPSTLSFRSSVYQPGSGSARARLPPTSPPSQPTFQPMAPG